MSYIEWRPLTQFKGAYHGVNGAYHSNNGRTIAPPQVALIEFS